MKGVKPETSEFGGQNHGICLLFLCVTFHFHWSTQPRSSKNAQTLWVSVIVGGTPIQRTMEVQRERIQTSCVHIIFPQSCRFIMIYAKKDLHSRDTKPLALLFRAYSEHSRRLLSCCDHPAGGWLGAKRLGTFTNNEGENCRWKQGFWSTMFFLINPALDAQKSTLCFPVCNRNIISKWWIFHRVAAPAGHGASAIRRLWGWGPGIGMSNGRRARAGTQSWKK